MASNLLKISGGLQITAQASPPASPQNGASYFNSTDGKYYIYRAGAWNEAADFTKLALSTGAASIGADATGFVELSGSTVQAQLAAAEAKLVTAASHISNTSNPHSVTKTQVGLGNVDNVQQLPMSYLDTDTTLAANSDTKVPSQKAIKSYVDTAVSGATIPDATTLVKGKIKLAGDLGGTADLPTVPGLAGKEPTITAGTTGQYWRGDKSWQTLDKTAVGLGNVDNTSDVNKPVSTAQQSALDLKLNLSGGTMSGAIAMGANQITGLADPTAAQHAATKAYVDAVALGLKPKAAVRVASTADITIASALINGAVVDGITLATGDRVLLKDQSSLAENGIYIVAASGAASRATDFDSLSPIDEINGAWVPVQLGTQAGRIYVQYGTVATLGSSDVTFEFYNPLASLVGGDMVTVTGSTISVDLATGSGLESSNPGNAGGQLQIKIDGSTLSKSATGIKVATSGITATELATDAVETLKIKDANVTLAKLASNSVDENKIVSTTMSATGAILGGGGTKLSVSTDDTTIEKSANALQIKDAGVSSAKLASDLLLKGTTKRGVTTSLVEEKALAAINLSASQTGTVITALTFAKASFEGMEMTYKVKDSSGNVAIGTFRVVASGAAIAYNTTEVETSSTGIVFSAVINGADINVSYDSGANTAVLMADVKYIIA